MTERFARRARLGFAVLCGALLTTVVSGEAFARHHGGRLDARLHNTRHAFASSHAELASRQPSQPGPLRYYGGPKSPMWRAPVEN